MSVNVESAVQTLRARFARAREERERHAAQVRARVEATVRAVAPEGARVWLIGSLAWGGFGVRSDVDLVLDDVRGEAATRIETEVARVAGCPVDVLELADLPEGFRRRVEEEGVRVDGA